MSAQCAPGEKEIENLERSFVFMKAALVIMAAGMGSRYGGNKQVDGIGPNGEILMEFFWNFFQKGRNGESPCILSDFIV